MLVSLTTALAQQRSAKRGVCWDEGNQKLTDAPASKMVPGVSWYYNWGQTPQAAGTTLIGTEDGIAYLPMCWNAGFNETALRNYLSTHPEVQYLLGFNEPNFSSQANMTPQQAANAWQIESKPSKGADNSRASETKAGGKNWAPIESGSSLIPKKTEYGMTVGDVKLSDKAKDYYEKLKAKYHNMEFIAVSKDMKDTVAKHAANYGNAGKAVVLIDEEKIERMATDEDFRKKYEGIISMGQQKLQEAKNSLASSGAKLLNFGMKVEDNGKVSFFATVEKSQEAQKARIEKKQEAKREARAK
jgi:hypothetical protein